MRTTSRQVLNNSMDIDLPTYVERVRFLQDIPHNLAFAFLAHFRAVQPWVLIINIDFISEKWRSIQQIRQRALLQANRRNQRC